jgi:hypothetical protein
MSCKLIASLISPFALVAALMAAAEAQPPPGGVFVPSGEKSLVAPARPKPIPRRKVADYAWEQFVHEATGEDYLREHFRYTNGDVESRIGPDVPEFIPPEFWPQDAPVTPAPGSVVPPACSSVVSTSTLTGSARTGRVIFDASVMCWRFGSGSTPCNTVKMTIYVDMVDAAGDLHPIAYTFNTYNSGCGATSHPYWDYTVSPYGTIRVTAKLFDLVTFAILANQTIEFQFTG